MKKDGFTLVELLAVLVLISAIVIFAVPSIINYISQSKEEISEVTEQLIFSGTELYIDRNKQDFPEVVNNQYCVTLQSVVDSNLLQAPIIDSISGNEIDLSSYVKVSYVYDDKLKINKYKYELVDECEPLLNE